MLRGKQGKEVYDDLCDPRASRGSLWLCAIGILVILMRNRKLRKRHGNIPVRVKRLGKQRWTRGQAIWVSDVFAWQGSPGL